MAEEIEITFDPKTDKITFETSGFKDNTCISKMEEVLKNLEKLGVKTDVVSQKKKPEGYVPAKGEKIGVKR